MFYNKHIFFLFVVILKDNYFKPQTCIHLTFTIDFLYSHDCTNSRSIPYFPCAFRETQKYFFSLQTHNFFLQYLTMTFIHKLRKERNKRICEYVFKIYPYIDQFLNSVVSQFNKYTQTIQSDDRHTYVCTDRQGPTGQLLKQHILQTQQKKVKRKKKKKRHILFRNGFYFIRSKKISSKFQKKREY